MLALPRRQGSLLALGMWGPKSLALALLGIGCVLALAASQQVLHPGWVALLIWSSIAPFLALGPTRTRCSRLEMALPVPARSLWLRHLATVLVSALPIAGLTAAMLVAASELVARARGREFPSLELGRATFEVLVVLVLALVLVESYRPALATVPKSRGHWWSISAILVGSGGLLVGLSAVPAAWTAVPLAAALALGLRTYRGLPPAFLEVPSQAEDPETAADADFAAGTWTATGRRGRWFLGLRLSIWAAGGAVAGIGYLFLLAVGWILGGGLDALDFGPDLRLIYLPLAVYMLLVYFGTGLGRLPSFDPLPVPRRTFLAALAVPGFLALVAGYGAGRLTALAREPGRELVRIVRGEDGTYVKVPAGFCEVAWDGDPPAPVSPWGETHPAWREPLFKGSPAVFYSPFATAEESSTEYFAWEISRAIEGVYGRTVPHTEILERYFVDDGHGAKILRRGDLRLRADFPDLRARDVGPVFPIVLAAVTVPWLTLTAIVLLTWRAGVREGVRQAVFWGLAFLVFSLLVLWLPAVMTGWFDLVAVRGTGEILIRHLGRTSWGPAAAWAVCAASITASFALTAAAFRRVELPARPKFGRSPWCST